MKKYDFHMYNVGQGLCTMLEGIRDDDSKYCAVFDCGTLKKGNFAPDNIVEVIAKITKARRGIDCIVISHQDYDHWSMLLNIIFVALGAESKDVLCKQHELYIKWNSDTTIVYNKEPGGDRIGYVFSEVLETRKTSVEIKVDSNNKVWGFEVILKFEKDTHWGDFTFSLEVDEEGKGKLSILLYNTQDKIEINEKLDVNFADIISDSQKMKEVRKKVEEAVKQGKIIDKYKGDKKFCKCYNTFLTKLNKLCISYVCMATTLSKKSNYDTTMYIGPIWMGGDSWEIGYTRLYYLLRRLVDCRIVKAVNGYTGGGGLPENPPKICGLVCMDETTSIGDFHTDAFSYDVNLLDINTKMPNWKSLAIQHNTTSLVVEFHTADGDRLLLPGDATVHVFSALAEKLDCNKGYNTLLAAPHHGSGHTNFCVVNKDVDKKQPLETLLAVLNDKCKGNLLGDCGISALANTFGHPSKRFKDTVIKYLSQNDETHEICYVRDDDGTKTAVCESTEKHLYCTETSGRNLDWSYQELDGKKQRRFQGTKEAGAGAARRPSQNEFL